MKTGANAMFSFKPEQRNESEGIVNFQTPLERHAHEPCWQFWNETRKELCLNLEISSNLRGKRRK